MCKFFCSRLGLPRWMFLWAVFAAVLVSRTAAAESFAGVDDKWRRYESPHFELFSQNADGDSRALLRHLEVLRAFFLDLLKLEERQPLEVTIYYFSRDTTFSAYKSTELSKKREISAYYLSRPDRAVIAMSSEHGDAEARRTVSHEYVHHLFRITEEKPPVWFNEGMAELFSTIEVGSTTLTIGLPIAGHVFRLQQENLLPLEALFAVDPRSAIYTTGEHTGLFYSESWGLLHYLNFGVSDIPADRLGRFLSYTQAFGAQADPATFRDAFNQSFGMDYRQMTQRLDNYFRGGKYLGRRAPLPTTEPPASYRVRAVSREEIRERLGELALRVNRSPQGKYALIEAVRKNPLNVRAIEALGTAAWVDGEPEAARERWDEAITAGSTNPAIFYEFAMMEYQRWFRIIDPYYRMPEERVQHLRDVLLRSIKQAPQQFMAYEILAWVEAAAEKPAAANVNLVQRMFAKLRNRQRTILALALVRIHSNDLAAADAMLAGLPAAGLEPEIARALPGIRSALEQARDRSAPDDASPPVAEPGKEKPPG